MTTIIIQYSLCLRCNIAKAAILKFSTPAIITSCKLIIVEYEAVLQFNQSTLLHTITGAIIIRMFKLLDILYNHI